MHVVKLLKLSIMKNDILRRDIDMSLNFRPQLSKQKNLSNQPKHVVKLH